MRRVRFSRSVPQSEDLFKMNILFLLRWEVSCWEELKWSDRRQCAVLIAALLSLSVFLCQANVIASQAWARPGWLSGPQLTVRISPCLLIVLGSNKNKHWVSGRAVYALQTNGDCSVIMLGGVECWQSSSIRPALMRASV